MADVKFTVSTADRRTIEKIGSRAHALLDYDRIHTMMDVTATHANGCPLDLGRLLEADDFNFVHDVGGIARHLDRETGLLMNCFRPRFARKIADARSAA